MWRLIGGFAAALVLIITLNVGFGTQAWAPWWFAAPGATGHGGSGGFDPDPGPLPVFTGGLTDLDRYTLAHAVGLGLADAIIATAISIAEDGSGNPAALSPANRDGSRDLGLWQINSSHWAEFGGQSALEVPINNARAMFVIHGRQGWCGWSTFETSCGIGFTGSYAAFIGRATAAAEAFGH